MRQTLRQPSGSPRITVEGRHVAQPIKGTQAPNTLGGTDGDDKLMGKDGNDLITGGKGNDDIDGGKGIDTAVYRGTTPSIRSPSAGTATVTAPTIRSSRSWTASPAGTAPTACGTSSS